MRLFFVPVPDPRGKIRFNRIRRQLAVIVFQRGGFLGAEVKRCTRRRAIKCRYIKILFRRDSANIDARRIEICIDSEIGKIFPLVKENVRAAVMAARARARARRSDENRGEG